MYESSEFVVAFQHCEGLTEEAMRTNVEQAFGS